MTTTSSVSLLLALLKSSWNKGSLCFLFILSLFACSPVTCCLGNNHSPWVGHQKWHTSYKYLHLQFNNITTIIHIKPIKSQHVEHKTRACWCPYCSNYRCDLNAPQKSSLSSVFGCQITHQSEISVLTLRAQWWFTAERRSSLSLSGRPLIAGQSQLLSKKRTPPPTFLARDLSKSVAWVM